jgi:uncharacterized protein YhhL (DUF1145 family)
MKKLNIQGIALGILVLFFLVNAGCEFPKPKQKTVKVKHNYIVLLDLSDRLIVQDKQPERDKEIIRELYKLFENRVKRNLYIKSRDEIKVVMAPQKGTRLSREVFEDKLYVNMENIKNIYRKPKEKQRRDAFFANIDSLYQQAVFSKNPENYNGADIWKYFYEDLKIDYAKDSLTQNFLFILTDGYPVVGKTQVKLQEVKEKFPDLHIILVEAAPREEDMEWDRIITIWEEWFDKIGVYDYTLIKRGAISKEIEQIEEIVNRI